MLKLQLLLAKQPCPALTKPPRPVQVYEGVVAEEMGKLQAADKALGHRINMSSAKQAARQKVGFGVVQTVIIGL